MPVFNASPNVFYWVYSRYGPAIDGIEDDLYFVEGLHPHPVAGPMAERYQLMGYHLIPYAGNEVFSGWDRNGNYWTPTFVSPGSNGGGDAGHLLPTLPPPEDWPEVLPGEYLGLFDRYTPQGKVKRKYRGR
jgi:hypothetical protein